MSGPSDATSGASRPGRQPREIVEPERLFETCDLIDRVLETVITEHLLLAILELRAERGAPDDDAREQPITAALAAPEVMTAMNERRSLRIAVLVVSRTWIVGNTAAARAA